MSWSNRVVWTEGMFLRTQHFQQADRYHERLAIQSLRAARADVWGVQRLQFDEHLLNEGRVGLTAVKGVFPDGTLFEAPESDDLPAPLSIPEDLRDAVIYLCAPIRQPGAADTLVVGADGNRRYRAVEIETPDVTEDGAAYATISVAKAALSIRSEAEDLAGFETVPIARVVERRADDAVSLDKNFIASSATCAASPPLLALMAEVRGLLHQRGQAIAARLGSASAGGVAEVTDFMLLQAVNRWEGLFRHLANLEDIHPERFYADVVALAGELCTFTEETNRPPEFPAYRHGDLQATFRPPMESLRRSLSAVFEQTAIPIPLETRGYNVRVGKIADRTLFDDCSFVLAATASVDVETLRALPKRTTVGAVERIRDLVNMQLGGAPIHAMPAEPRQIPYRKGQVYFSVNDGHEEWKVVRSSGGVAIHVSGELPDLELALWAIRGRR